MSKHLLVAIPEEVDFKEQIDGIPVHFCGVGKLNAAMGAHELLMRGTRSIINIGSCGSRQRPLGEILRIGRVYQDIDASPICDYGLTPFEEPAAYIELDADSEITCFTTDYFYDHSQRDKYSEHYLRMISACTVFDMELFAMAKVCKRHGIGLKAFKWVSDDGDHSSWMENCRLSLHRLISEGLLRNPG